MSEKINLLNDGMQKWLSTIDYYSTWSIAQHLRLIMIMHIIREKSVIDNKARVLDIGAGNGYVLNILEKNKIPCEIDCIELNERYAKSLSKKKFTHGKKAVFHTDFLEFSTRQRYDIIVMGEFIEHVEKKKVKDVLDKTHNLLKKDGSLVITTPNKQDGEVNWPEDHDDEFTFSELKEALKDSRLKISKAFGLWADTKYTTAHMDFYEMISELFSQAIPHPFINVFCNLLSPEKSKALFIIAKREQE
jgi:cyclopropane fatty-acyl-phospholipid synthase-like methyltransferase